MTECTSSKLVFSRLKPQKVEGYFDGGRLTSDAGALLLRKVDRPLASPARLCRFENRIREQQLGLFADRTAAKRRLASHLIARLGRCHVKNIGVTTELDGSRAYPYHHPARV